MNGINDLMSEKYSRLDEEEIDESDEPDEDAETPDPAHASAFRDPSWEDDDDHHDFITEAANNLLLNRSNHSGESHHSEKLHLTSANSFILDDDDWDAEDEASLRRYNLDFKTEMPADFRPAEFESMPRRLYMHFMNLRTAARQRQAARLLNMPSEAFLYRYYGYCMTLCDATDRGIMLVAVCLALWLFIGLMARNHVTSFYWMTGIAAFVVRVSARRCYEHVQGKRFRAHRLRLSSIELGSDSSYRATATKEDTSDSEEIV
ncbi:hypothetical protein MPSEU_000305500 [Mayamaea pseudoterrestris]|nr:hypothetical protein MPSEU_000305500 [Mayamaea pseudoterrestris]